ncbi:unnamed protein product [Rotaria sordida]|uniref:RNA-directed RNA polymerase n=1 Tax=Rotaria sordida TaxID=392033 RepID=A0A815R9H5_9BILA|nr:unnamed protein product [Rotaria sordida]
MDLLTDDSNETLMDENIIIPDCFDDRLNMGEDDDLIKDPEDDQRIDEELNREIEQANTIANEPEDIYNTDDEDTGINDSGFDENSTPDHIQESPTINSTPTLSLGRGRLGKKPVDENNHQLPAPQVRDVEPDKDFYSKPARIAKLPLAYYRKREGPTVQNERRAPRVSSPLIDFRATFTEISFIVDKDDSGDKGYRHACKRFEQLQPDIDLNSSKFIYDIWSFGLYISSIKLEKSVSCSLIELFPQEINNEENRPYWFMFKRVPMFYDSILRDKISKESDSAKGILIKFDRTIYADLSYGALTSMNRFYLHQDYIFRKKTRWSLYFRDDAFDITTNEFHRLNNNTDSYRIRRKYKIPLDIIDRAVIVQLRNDGFDLFVNMKGNVHELYGEIKSKSAENNIFVEYERQGKYDREIMPLFSTTRIRIRLKNNQSIVEYLERDDKISKNTLSNEKDDLLQTCRDESLKNIRKIFRTFLDFFYNNRIRVCFGSVGSRNVSLGQLSSLKGQRFSTFTQSYSWAMLCNIGFRAQIQLNLTKKFINCLHEYSGLKFDEKYSSDIDNRFYRLCLYLHRRLSEYFFLDLDKEIEIGIEDYKDKYVRSKQKKFEILKFNQLTTSTAYIPSVVLTPTTIKIRPLKLCKLNRVLREKRFGGCLNFALVELRDEAQRLLFPTAFRSLKEQILYYLTDGFLLTPERRYKYLHHSQSQVKCKQFWFYYHDKEHGYLSHEDAYIWMGNFDKERVVAKHAARIALCFTSTDATIQITADKVTYERDIKDATKKYTFTDGVGTISIQLRDEIKEFLKRRRDFSVLQIRYGGCKGTFSVDPRLDTQQYQLQIRDSMNKFISDHDILEICKLSAPRTLYLNRQDIVLLESRDIPHTTFLCLQNEDHLWLIRSLLTPSIAYELLQEKILPIFRLHKIARKINIIEEQFFIKLITTCAFNIIRELIDRTRIRISDKKARNMFGIVDEYGILEYGQVFIQYTIMHENKLYLTKEEKYLRKNNIDQCRILTNKVVVTKNPCHHPGDLRVFDAIDCLELRHLKDVIVFPQKGPRPHSNEISGSDLDGDEYVVIWHEDLIPQTPNETAYEYDSQEDPPKLNHPITRDDINQVVMEVSEQDCLGTLSNIHLAYADKQGIKSETCIKLAGDISQEVDAAKTGKHPLTNEEIVKLRKGLEDKWPDFMKGRGKKEYYPSERILGKLYRSARRAVVGWSRAISNHGNLRHINLALALTSGTDIKDQELDDETIKKSNILINDEQLLDPLIKHDNSKKYLSEIKTLYRIYQTELLEIISLYRFQDEIDLFCRCESMDASAGGSKKGSLEDSAAIEVQNLIYRIKQDFYNEFDQRRQNNGCCKFVKNPDLNHTKRIDCEFCNENKLAKAACAYIYSYQQSHRLPTKSNRRILSFPWLFSEHLIELRYKNRSKDFIDQSNQIVSNACSDYLKNLEPKFKVFIPEYSIDIPLVEFYYRKIEEKPRSLLRINGKSDEKISPVPLLRACFIEILNDWLIKQNIFDDNCIETDQKPLIPESIWHELLIKFLSNKNENNVRLILALQTQNFITERYRQIINNYRIRWTNIEDQQLQDMFLEIHKLARDYSQTTQLTIWSYLDEYIMLALQCIGIEKRLVDNWICSPTI